MKDLVTIKVSRDIAVELTAAAIYKAEKLEDLARMYENANDLNASIARANALALREGAARISDAL